MISATISPTRWQYSNDSRDIMRCHATSRIKTPAPGMQSWISNFQTHIKDTYIEHFLWVKATRHHWCLVSIRSVNDSVPSGKTAITWANVDPDLYRHMASLDHRELKIFPCKFVMSSEDTELKTTLNQDGPSWCQSSASCWDIQDRWLLRGWIPVADHNRSMSIHNSCFI